MPTPLPADDTSDRASDVLLQRPWLAGFEVLTAAALVLCITWKVWDPIPHGPWRTAASVSLYVLVVAVVATSFLRVRDSVAQLGVSPRRWGQGWASIGLFTAAALGAIALAALLLEAAQVRHPGTDWMLAYVPAALAQQVLLQGFLNNRLYAFGHRMRPQSRLRLAVGGSTLVFILLHAPNPALMAFVAVSGLFWTWHFRRHLNLPALTVSHVILGIAAMTLLGDHILLRLRIGLGAYNMLTGTSPM